MAAKKSKKNNSGRPTTAAAAEAVLLDVQGRPAAFVFHWIGLNDAVRVDGAMGAVKIDRRDRPAGAVAGRRAGRRALRRRRDGTIRPCAGDAFRS